MSTSRVRLSLVLLGLVVEAIMFALWKTHTISGPWAVFDASLAGVAVIIALIRTLF